MTPQPAPEPSLPEAFRARMRHLLGPEADALFAALREPSRTGLRVNTQKLAVDRLREMAPWPLEEVPWCPSGFLVEGEERPGRHPYHAAGLFYLQEPSAMAVAEVLAPQPGERVLDLAAAPGGKATHLASLMGDAGVLVANEIEPSRTRALASNLERWGARRALLTNEPPHRLAERWPGWFDRVLVDAPCSGEGMFRKTEAAAREWSPENVAGCATRGERLIRTAADLVRPGGWMAYSTCTFAPEENERVVAGLLRDRPDYELRAIELPGAAPGVPEWLPPEERRPELRGAARLWPHRVPGEGHFVALLQRTGGEEGAVAPHAPAAAPRAVRELWESWAADALTADPAAELELGVHNDQLYALPGDFPDTRGVRVVRAGLWLGSARRGRFEPSHSLALALGADQARHRVDLDADDPRLARYLEGHPLPVAGPAGWALVTVEGHGLGWGRRAQDIVKNQYPKGLRRPPT